MAFIIAELGSSAYPFARYRLGQMVRAAAYARADAVKVQLFRAVHFPNDERAAKYPLEFPRHDFEWFIDQAHKHGLRAGASVFDNDAVDCSAAAGADFVKLAAREESNQALRDYVHDTWKGGIIRSVEWLPDVQLPARPVERRKREVTLACVPKYPTPMTVQLWRSVGRADLVIPHPWGWSSHTQFSDDCLAAAANGAAVIEKHLCITDDDLEAKHSLRPSYFLGMVLAARALAQ